MRGASGSKRQPKGDVYFLDGCAVTGRTSVSICSDEDDTYKLWHIRLGHAGEKALQVGLAISSAPSEFVPISDPNGSAIWRFVWRLDRI